MPCLRPRSLIIAATVALTVVLGACSTSGETIGDRVASAAPGEQAAALDTTAAEPFVPDPIADPGVEPGSCKTVTYTPTTAKDKQVGELCRPADNQRDVVVMLVHGGAGIGGAYQGMQGWADRLLAEGYVTFSIDYHLFSPGATTNAVFPLPEQNVKAATQFLRGTANALGIQRDHIVVEGFSAGARIAAVVYTSPDDPYFAGPELWPDISDAANGLVGFYHPYDGSMQYSDQYYGGSDKSTDPAVEQRWDKADSLSNASNAIGPALFITGSKDWELQEQQQLAFTDALVHASIPAQQNVIAGGLHGFDNSGGKLTRLGEQSATIVLVWLNDEFPQNPGREAQTGAVDLTQAPDRAGDTATTFEPRSRPSRSGSTRNSTTTTWKATAPSTTTSTWHAPPSTTPSPPTTQAPATSTTTAGTPTTTSGGVPEGGSTP